MKLNSKDERKLKIAIFDEIQREQFEKDVQEFGNGKIDPTIPILTREEILSKLRMKAFGTVLPKTNLKPLLSEIGRQLRTVYLPYARIQFGVEAALVAGVSDRKEIFLPEFGENAKIKFAPTDDSLRIYTNVSEMMDKTLGFYLNGKKIAECKFESDDEIKGMTAFGEIEFDNLDDESEKELKVEVEKNNLNNLELRIIE